MSKKLYLIDGSGLIFRAYHALPPLSRPDGTPIGAVLGFTNMLVKLITDMSAHQMAVIFDSARKNFRHEIYADYKANRPEAPQDLLPQFGLVREACTAFGVPMVEQMGYEADDIIATYVREALADEYEVIIVSSDKDLMQLVSSQVTMLDQMKDKVFGIKEVEEKFGVSPERVLDVLSLAGDASDNVPGVPGIGVKTAAELVQRFGSLEGIFENLAEITQPKRRLTLEENEAQAMLSKKLITLDEKVPVDKSVQELKVDTADPEVLNEFLHTQGFKALIRRFGIEPKSPSVPKKPMQNIESSDYELIQDVDHLNRWITAIERQGFVAIDTETTSLNAYQAKLVGITLSIEPGKAAYIPLNHYAQPRLDHNPEDHKQLKEEMVLALLDPILRNKGILKIGHNLKYDMLVLKKFGLVITPLDDTMLLSYLLAPGPHGLDKLALEHFDHEMIPFKDLVGPRLKAKDFSEVPLAEACTYAAEDADYTLRLWHLLKSELLSSQSVTAYETLERPLVQILVDMEAAGIKVDAHILHRLSHEFGQELKSLETEIHEIAGHPFNIASPKQLGNILFEEMKLAGGKKTKSGAYATGAEVLEKLDQDGSVFAGKVLEWRQFAKLKSTYTDSLLAEINMKTGRVHTSYAMAVTNTGRLSSSDPNLQNIPVRTDVGRKIRKAFVAEKGHKLLSLDYSQIELRLLASMANITALKEAFAKGMDIHRLTASQVFGVSFADVTPEIRRQAKAINFGIIYGISAFGLAKQLEISNGEAAQYIKAYNMQYPGILDYMERTKEFARNHGYVQTLFGRRCYVPMINAKNPMQRAFAERQATNAPLQGTAADIIKRAMIQMPGALSAAGLKTRMLLQVHDELVFEVPEAEVDAVGSLAKQVMEGSARLDVPLVAEVGVGDNWDAAH